jgi:hypothetical protein
MAGLARDHLYNLPNLEHIGRSVTSSGATHLVVVSIRLIACVVCFGGRDLRCHRAVAVDGSGCSSETKSNLFHKFIVVEQPLASKSAQMTTSAMSAQMAQAASCACSTQFAVLPTFSFEWC